MGHVVPPLQNDVSATLRDFPDLVRKGQRVPNKSFWRLFQLFGTRFAGDIHTWKFGSKANGRQNGSRVPLLFKT